MPVPLWGSLLGLQRLLPGVVRLLLRMVLMPDLVCAIFASIWARSLNRRASRFEPGLTPPETQGTIS